MGREERTSVFLNLTSLHKMPDATRVLSNTNLGATTVSHIYNLNLLVTKLKIKVMGKKLISVIYFIQSNISKKSTSQHAINIQIISEIFYNLFM